MYHYILSHHFFTSELLRHSNNENDDNRSIQRKVKRIYLQSALSVYESPVSTPVPEACPVPVSIRALKTRVEAGGLCIGNAEMGTWGEGGGVLYFTWAYACVFVSGKSG